MKKILFFTSVVLCSLSSISMAGSIHPLSGMEAKKLIEDKTVKTISAATLNGQIVDNSFAGFFGKDGKVSARFANPPASAPQADTGTWKMGSHNNICFTWQHWNNSQEQCVTLYKLSNAILVLGSGKKFNSLVLNENIKPGNTM